VVSSLKGANGDMYNSIQTKGEPPARHAGRQANNPHRHSARATIAGSGARRCLNACSPSHHAAMEWADMSPMDATLYRIANSYDHWLQRRYVKADAGDLQAIDVNGRKVLALLRQPVTGAATGTSLYRLQSTRTIDGSATTFHNDKATLLRLLPGLDADFGAWDGYGGIAIHELR